MVRAVRERRRQVGVLRALGFQAAAVRAAFVVESAFVAVEGVVDRHGARARVRVVDHAHRRVRRRARVPDPVSGSIGLLVVGTFVCALLATAAPARVGVAHPARGRAADHRLTRGYRRVAR